MQRGKTSQSGRVSSFGRQPRMDDKIDFERAVHDPAYRREVLDQLNRQQEQEGAEAAREGRPEAAKGRAS